MALTNVTDLEETSAIMNADRKIAGSVLEGELRSIRRTFVRLHNE